MSLAFGASGTNILVGETTVRPLSLIQAMEDSVVTVTVNWVDFEGNTIVAGKSLTIAAGDVRYCIFTSVLVVSGEVTGY